MSITAGGVWKPKLKFKICALVIPCRGIQLDNETVRGHCGNADEIQYKPLPNMMTDFLNWPGDPDAILKFTKKYGPVVVPFRKTGRQFGYAIPKRQRLTVTERLWPGQAWSFSLESWRSRQVGLQQEWETRAECEEDAPLFRLGHEDELQFHKTEDQITLRVASPERFLPISLYALPAERMKTCNRPREDGCPTPYFIATHFSQAYCSPECAAWAQKAVKRNWWKERQKQKTTSPMR